MALTYREPSLCVVNIKDGLRFSAFIIAHVGSGSKSKREEENSFARSARSLGTSPHYCEAHHLHGVQPRSFVSALRRNDVELTLK